MGRRSWVFGLGSPRRSLLRALSFLNFVLVGAGLLPSKTSFKNLLEPFPSEPAQNLIVRRSWVFGLWSPRRLLLQALYFSNLVFLGGFYC
jgi:hypothetical protein